MQSFFKKYELKKDKPWLIVGKGPTFERINDIDLSKYYVMGLNEVAQIIPCEIAHFIDVEVISYNFINNSDYIVSPVRPHKNCKVSNRYLATWYFIPYHDELNAINKLYCYNCSTYKGAHFEDFGPTIKVKYFSAEAAFRLLALKDIKLICTLGIDGGNKYAKDFAHIKPLRNGRVSFDDQFNEIKNIINKFNLEWIQL